MSDVLVSFIIPVYNTAEYLRQCLNSILVQTYTNIEIIIVDDGSTDRSPYICDEYAKKDSRIVAYHKKNGGLSDARNFGLNHAKGDYIVFLDSDDFWAKDSCLSELIKILNDSPCCEFVGFNMSYYFQESGIYRVLLTFYWYKSDNECPPSRGGPKSCSPQRVKGSSCTCLKRAQRFRGGVMQ